MEIKEGVLVSYNGNYDSFLKQNAVKTTNSVIGYENTMDLLAKAEKKVEWGNRMRAKSKAWKIKYDRFVREYEDIKKTAVKPSFWIDQESRDMMDKEVLDKYHEYKEKNISIHIAKGAMVRSELLRFKDFSLGYDHELFEPVNLIVHNGEKVFIKGRNGAGKSTLVHSVVSASRREEPTAKVYRGELLLGVEIRVGEYEQETDPRFMEMSLGDAIRTVYREKDIAINDTQIKQLLSRYLFNPVLDEKQMVNSLSGGQKSRFQLIKMLSNNPNLLILDEPTNHLDLPSIEELEDALLKFGGAIMYISHDSYFVKKMGGIVLAIGKGEV